MSHGLPHRLLHARIASYVPGRLRIKLQPRSRQPHAVEQLKEQVGACDGVHEVTLNPRAGSVTVHFDDQRHSITSVLQLLQDLDVVFAELARMPRSEPPLCASCVGQPSASAQIVDGVAARLPRLARRGLNLKMVIPLAFAGAGLWSIARQGLMEGSPGWLLLRLALETFTTLNPVRD